MLKKYTLPLLFLIFTWEKCIATDLLEQLEDENTIVLTSKRIVLEHYPDAYNPSLIKFKSGFLLTFRYPPDPYRLSISYIGVVLLNENLEQISEPEILNTRFLDSKTLSQSEDARIFSYRDRLFLIFNDNIENHPWNYGDRRDMFIAELFYKDNHFSLSAPLKLCHEKKSYQLQQKNWIPFEWDNTLLLAYCLNPHEILYPNLYNGRCYTCYETPTCVNWNFGTLRGGTPPILLDGEYLAFFHSATQLSSNASWNISLWHYFMGAYTFSTEPPFSITKITSMPIVGRGFYTRSSREKRVIFPGGAVATGPHIYVAYGKDDSEIWIATLDKEALKKALIPLNNQGQ